MPNSAAEKRGLRPKKRAAEQAEADRIAAEKCAGIEKTGAAL